MPSGGYSRQITKVLRVCKTLQLLVEARGADFREYILLHWLVVLVDDMHEADAVGAAVGQDIGHVKIAKSGDQLPLAAVELPDLVLIETVQSPVSNRRSLGRCSVIASRGLAMRITDLGCSKKKARQRP